MLFCAFQWLDDSKHFTKRAALKKTFDDMLGQDTGRLDPNEMIAAMVAIVPARTGQFRNVVPEAIEELLKDHQQKAWGNEI